ncbi:MAG TPA: hypothetical protein DDX98_10210, partial [Bacteroidales bacterium]|nr:hypothetical protein [Bacteroidales bacterium]
MNAKQEFTNNQIWVLTFRGAFQRAGIYSSDVSNTQKTQFKFKLRGFVENLVEAEYLKGAVSEQNHLHNIKEVQSYSQNFNSILINSELNFGVSQKILNLYLKHQWCLGRIPEPPHFPMDRIIQIKLGCN